jgi:hypothetical protein
MKRIIEATTANVANKTLINVDIQPEYESKLSFPLAKWINFLNQSYDRVSNMVFLYNGHDTLGMINEDNYKMWLIENGLKENVLDGCVFYDKGYAFFRYCIDSYVDEDAITNFVRFMYQNNVRDSRDMTREMWAKYLREYRRTDRKEVYTLLRASGDCVHVPDLMDFLKRYNGIVLTGGSINECLKEVEIALKALGKNYTVFTEFTY